MGTVETEGRGKVELMESMGFQLLELLMGPMELRDMTEGREEWVKMGKMEALED